GLGGSAPPRRGFAGSRRAAGGNGAASGLRRSQDRPQGNEAALFGGKPRDAPAAGTATAEGRTGGTAAGSRGWPRHGGVDLAGHRPSSSGILGGDQQGRRHRRQGR